MSEIKPFRVVMKLRNNRMASVRGERKQVEMDKLCCISSGTWGAYEGLKKSPVSLDRKSQLRCYVCAECIATNHVVCSEHSEYRKEAESKLPAKWRELALRIAAACDKEPEFFWPECIVAIEKPIAIAVEISSQQLERLSPSDRVEKKQLADGISNIVGSLSIREEEIVNLRFGLNGNREHTLEEIAQLFEVTRERIRQLEGKALRKLRHPSRTNRLNGLVDDETQQLIDRGWY